MSAMTLQRYLEGGIKRQCGKYRKHQQRSGFRPVILISNVSNICSSVLAAAGNSCAPRFALNMAAVCHANITFSFAQLKDTWENLKDGGTRVFTRVFARQTSLLFCWELFFLLLLLRDENYWCVRFEISKRLIQK